MVKTEYVPSNTPNKAMSALTTCIQYWLEVLANATRQKKKKKGN